METSLTLYIDTNTQSNQLFDDGSKAVWDNGASIVLRDSVEAVPFPSLNNPVVIHDFQFTAKRMGAAPTITASFYYPTCLDKEWTYKVFAVFGGERYFIKQIPTSGIANTEGMYQHSIELVSERVLLDNVYFYDVVNSEVGADKPVSNSSKFSFFGDINEFAKRINESLKYRNLDYTVVVDDGITSAAYTVAFDNKVISEVLQEVYNVYNLPYYFDGKTIHIGYTNNAITETFRYGVDDALLSINKENANYKVVTAVSGSGSEDNIPYYYPNDYESKEEVEAHGGTWINPSSTLQPPIYRESLGKERFYQAKNYVYPIPGSYETYTFDNLYEEGRPKEHIIDFSDIKPTITGIKNALGYGIDTFLEFAYDAEDNDEVDEEGNYLHPYFFAKLRKFDGSNGFNLFDHAIDEAQMTISMTSGSCGSCEFIIGVGEDTQKNLVQVDGAGNLVRDENGNVRCGRDGMPVEEPQDRQNDTMNYEVWIALKKDVNTFGVVMPNATNKYRPSVTDTFVILHIDLPKAYVLAAEERLKDALIAYMADNNSEKFNFSIAFSRIYFAEHPEVLALLNENARVQLEYNGDYIELYVSSFSYTMSKDTPLPEIKVELADTLTISQNALQTAINDLKGSGFGGIGVGASGDILKLGLAYFLRKDMNDRTRGKLSSDVGFEVGRYVSGASGATMFLDKQTGKTTAEMDKLYVRVKAYFETLEIVNVNSVGGKQIISPAGSMKCVKVENDSTKSYYRCYVLSEQDGEKIENRFHVGDQVYSQMFNAKPGVSNKVSNHYWWRLCVGVGEDYIDISKTDCDSDSDAPAVGDIMCQRGNRNDVDRQNFIELSSVDAYSPNITLFQGVNSYSLVNKDIISYGVDKTTNQAFMNIYGNMYVGDRENNSYLRYSIENGLQLKGTLDVGTKFGDKTLQEMLDKYAYLGRAFKENTKIVGGVIQTSSTVLGYTDDSGEYVVMSGTNGLVGDKGLKSIAFWAGGDMVDIFDYWDKGNNTFNVPAGVRPATALDRMDGTGYRANGALWWENDGNVHANPLSFFVGENTVGALFAAFQIYPNNSSNPLYIIPHAPFTQFMLSTPASAGTDDYIFTPTDEALKLTRKKSTNANFWASGDIVAYAAGGGDITLPIASANALGAVKIGDGLSIAADGTLSATNTGSIAGIESSGAGNVVTSLDVISGGKVLLYTKGLTALTTTDYASTLDTRYVKKSGDTMTGALTTTKFTSNIATGTAPLSVSSTTVCANLNADMLDGLHSDNFTRSWYLGMTVDAAVNYIVFGKAYTGTLITGFSFTGTVSIKRGAASEWNNIENINISISAQYNENKCAFTYIGFNALAYRAVTLVYNSETYLALEMSARSSMHITVYGAAYDNINLFLTTAANVSNVTAVSTAHNKFKAGLIISTQGITSQDYVHATNDIVAYSTGSGDITLPIASSSALGAIKVGSGLSIASDGTLSATGAGSIGSVVVDGTGNAVTTASASGTTLTLTKGNSFLPLSGGTLTGALTATKFTSNVVTGTSPISVSSTTLCSNLNADLLDGLQSTAFARADQSPAVDLNTVNGFGIMCNPLNANATTERNYPIAEAGVLFYGTAAYNSANQIYGSFWTNRWFARGGNNSTTTKTAWKEFAFKTDNVASATNADMLDGIHASGLFTNLSNSGNNLSVTIGGTNKTLTVGYASSTDNLDGYHGILQAEDTGYYLNYKLGYTGNSKIYYLIGTLPLPSAAGSGQSYVDFEVTGLTDFGNNTSQSIIVHASTRGSAKVEYITFGGISHGVAAYKTTSSNVEIWIYCNANYSGYTTVKILRSYAFTRSMTHTTTDPGSLVEGVYMPIPKVGSITSTGDVIAYSTGTSNAPFKYWRPIISQGVLSWVNDTSTTTPSSVTIVGQGTTYQWSGRSLKLGTINAAGSTTWGTATNLTGQGLTYQWSGTQLRIGTIAAGEGTTSWGSYVNLKGAPGPSWSGGAISSSITTNWSGQPFQFLCNGVYFICNHGGTPTLFANTGTGFNSSANIQFTASTVKGVGFSTSSDIRLKKDIETLTNMLDKINNIRAVKFRFKDEKIDRVHYGVIAQEIMEHFKDVVYYDSTDEYSVNYQELTAAISICGIKELYSLVKSQQAKIEELEKRLAAIES